VAPTSVSSERLGEEQAASGGGLAAWSSGHSNAGLKPGETLTEGQTQAAQEPVRGAPGWNFLLNDWIVSCRLSPSEVDLDDRTTVQIGGHKNCFAFKFAITGRELEQTLGKKIALYVSVIVFASPNIPAITFHSIGHHVINQPVLIPAYDM